MESTTTTSTADTVTDTAAPEAPVAEVTPFVTEVRTRMEGIARDVVAHTVSVAGQVGELAGVTAERVRTELTQARDAGRDRFGDVRGRVQPVVEQVQSQATRVAGAGIERVRGLVGRGAERSDRAA